MIKTKNIVLVLGVLNSFVDNSSASRIGDVQDFNRSANSNTSTRTNHLNLMDIINETRYSDKRSYDIRSHDASVRDSHNTSTENTSVNYSPSSYSFTNYYLNVLYSYETPYIRGYKKKRSWFTHRFRKIFR